MLCPASSRPSHGVTLKGGTASSEKRPAHRPELRSRNASSARARTWQRVRCGRGIGSSLDRAPGAAVRAVYRTRGGGTAPPLSPSQGLCRPVPAHRLQTKVDGVGEVEARARPARRNTDDELLALRDAHQLAVVVLRVPRRKVHLCRRRRAKTPRSVAPRAPRGSGSRKALPNRPASGLGPSGGLCRAARAASSPAGALDTRRRALKTTSIPGATLPPPAPLSTLGGSIENTDESG